MSGLRGWIVPVLLLLLAPACADGPSETADPAGAAGPEEAVRIVVLGSSTAEGAGASPADSAWVSRYDAYLKKLDSAHRVFNLAQGGYTTYHLLPTGHTPPPNRPPPDAMRNITKALTDYAPTVLVINLPSNDVASGFTVEEQLANFQTILDAAAAASVPVWVATTQPRNLDEAGRRAQMAVRDSIRARLGDRAIDFWSGLARDDGSVDPAFDSGDGIHVNNAGHRLLFERVRATPLPGTR